MARRLDDPDKMATLQGGFLGPDPGALSPAQQEQLNRFKVGAPPTPASVKGRLPRDGGRKRGEVREEEREGRFPGKEADGWGAPGGPLGSGALNRARHAPAGRTTAGI